MDFLSLCFYLFWGPEFELNVDHHTPHEADFVGSSQDQIQGSSVDTPASNVTKVYQAQCKHEEMNRAKSRNIHGILLFITCLSVNGVVLGLPHRSKAMFGLQLRQPLAMRFYRAS